MQGNTLNQYEKQREKDTIANVNFSRSLLSDLQGSLIEGAKKTTHEKQEAAKLVRQLKTNMIETEPHFQACEQMVSRIDECYPQLKRCLKDTEHMHQSLHYVLELCQRRIEHRDLRPMSEKIEDGFHCALMCERELIMRARGDLDALVNKCDYRLGALEACKTYLVKDLTHKRQAFRMAQGAMKESRQVYKEYNYLPRPHSFSLSRENSARYRREEDPATAALKLQEQFAVDVDEMMLSVRNVHSEALKVCEECAVKREQVRNDVEDATFKTEESMVASILRMSQLKGVLSQQIVETNEAIKAAETVLTRASHFEDPSSEPGQPVQRVSLKWQGALEDLHELKESEAQMRDDLKHKIVALRIDEACRKMRPGTAPRNPSQSRPQSARARPIDKEKKKPPFYPSAGRPQVLILTRP